MKNYLFLMLILLALVSQVSGQSSPVRIRMPDSTYSAILVGVAGTRTAGDTVTGAWSTYYRMHEFSGVAATGRYKLYVDAAGGTTYTLVSTWGGTYGKVVAGYDLYQWMERLNANEEVLSIGLGDTSVSSVKIKNGTIAQIDLADSIVSLAKLTTAALNYIGSGGTVTNNPDDVTLKNKSGSTIGIHDNILDYDPSGDTLQFYPPKARFNKVYIDSSLQVRSKGQATASYGAEKLANGGFDSDLGSWTAGAGWAWSAGGYVLHTAGNTATLTQAISVTTDSIYQVTIITSASGWTPGTYISIQLGSLETSYQYPTVISGITYHTYSRSYKATATASVTFTITPESAFDGKIDYVSIKSVKPGTVPAIQTYVDSSGSTANEMRVNYTLQNTFIGLSSGSSVKTAWRNTAVGNYSQLYAVSGYDNVSLGRNTLYYNRDGYRNVAVGNNVLKSNTWGFNNTAVGFDCMQSNTSGTQNVAVGIDALYYNTTGYRNTAIGTYALQQNDSYDNVAIGFYAGYNSGLTLDNLTGCVFIGKQCRPTVDDLTNAIGIGYHVYNTKSNQVMLGNSSITETQLQGDVTISSGYLKFDEDLYGNAYTSGANAWTTTAENDTVLISGASVNDRYSITLTGTAAPSANDAFVMNRKANAFVLIRSAAGTSGLGYMWTRQKFTPTEMADSLTVDLVAYYAMEEDTGLTRVDAAGFNDLSDNDNVASSATHIGGDSSAYFVLADSTYLSCADNANISMGAAQDFTMAFWVYPDSLVGRQEYIHKWTATGDQREYAFVMGYNDTTVKNIAFRYSATGAAAGQGYIASDTVLVTDRWFFVAAWWNFDIDGNSDADSLYLQVNNGKIHRSKVANGAYNGTSALKIGCPSDEFSGTNKQWTAAKIDEFTIWKRVLTTAELTYLYNSGSGRTYSAGKIQ